MLIMSSKMIIKITTFKCKEKEFIQYKKLFNFAEKCRAMYGFRKEMSNIVWHL